MNPANGITVKDVAAIAVPDPLPPAIVRPRRHVEAVLGQSLAETGTDGRVALAWAWALTGSRPAPVTLSLGPGRPPSRDQILAEAHADPEGPAAPAGVPGDYWDQIGDVRRVLRWLAGESDEIPLDDQQRGRFIGARDDYARSDAEIRLVLDAAAAAAGSGRVKCPDADGVGGLSAGWRQSTEAGWESGVRDVLEWVLGHRPTGPLSGFAARMPAVGDLSYEESAAADLIARGDLARYGEAAQATIAWLRGETTTRPVDRHGNGPYSAAAG